MEIIHLSHPLDLSQVYPPSVMSIGYFDGIHIGHQKVIQKGIDIARKLECLKTVMTFDPHPREVLGKGGSIHYLTPLGDKLNLLGKMGMDRTYIVRFDVGFSSIYPKDFIDQFLIPMKVKHVVVGFDYTFGYRGDGTAETMKDCSRGRYGVDIVGPVNRFGEKISSTLIRNYLHQGEIQMANMLLGRPYYIEGPVVHGEKRGRTIGFPTANIDLQKNYVVPKTGVYGVKVYVKGREYFGVMNIGIKPTFNDPIKEKTLEVHILDLKEELYGQDVGVEVLFFLRNEKKFAGIDELKAQINKDVENAKKGFLADSP